VGLENPISSPNMDEPPPDLRFRGLHRERRTMPRWGGNPIVVEISDAEGQTTPHRAVIIDRSDTGVGLSVDRKVEPGCVLSLRAAGAVGEAPWVRMVVKNCLAAGPYWEVGCQFLEAPAADVARLFG
jgi:PilZ domain